MVEENPTTPALKQPSWFQSALGRATAIVGALTALTVALVAFVKSFDELAAALRRAAAGFSHEAPAGSPALVPTGPRQAAEPMPPVENATAPRHPAVEHAARALFIITPSGSDGVLIGTRARRVFEQEGFALAGDRAAASVTVEIAPPSFGPARTLANSGLEITSMAAALQATITSRAEGTPVSPPQQREAVGRGDGEEAARRDAVSRAADQLSERITAVLRQSAGGGPRP